MRLRFILMMQGVASILVMVPLALALQIQGGAPPTSYDVVSIKLESPDPSAIGIRYTMTGFEAYAVTLTDLIKAAYGLPDERLVKGASNLKTKYHILSKLSENDTKTKRSFSAEEAAIARQKLLQNILLDRFQLAVHHSTSPLAIYSLEVSAHGLKLYIATPEIVRDPNGAGARNISEPGSDSFFADGRIKGIFSMGQLVHILSLSRKVDSDASDRTVIDNTGLKGRYIVDLAWTGPSNQPPPMVSSETEIYGSADSALDQAGLRLVPKSIDADSVVVDHANTPNLD